jgi:4-carboxymuconolactone decarboxylase
MKFRYAIAVIALLSAVGTAAHAADRFSVIPLEKLSPEQNKLIQTMLAGPRGGGDTSPEKVKWVREHGLFGGYLQSPELGDRLQKVGEYVRFNTSINPRLNEFAILITARYWTAQYEWYAHLPLAVKAGLDPKIAEQLAQNKRPAGMKEDEAAVYDFCTQLHRSKKVSDATFKRAVGLFGEKGVMDLIGVIGYYTVASMILNVNEAPVPPGEKTPLKNINK